MPLCPARPVLSGAVAAWPEAVLLPTLRGHLAMSGDIWRRMGTPDGVCPVSHVCWYPLGLPIIVRAAPSEAPCRRGAAEIGVEDGREGGRVPLPGAGLVGPKVPVVEPRPPQAQRVRQLLRGAPSFGKTPGALGPRLTAGLGVLLPGLLPLSPGRE